MFIIYQKVGHVPASGTSSEATGDNEETISFRNPPEGTDLPPALSVPVGHRSILAEIRAPAPPRHTNPIMQPHHGSAARGSLYETCQNLTKPASMPISTSLPIPIANGWRAGTMSRGNISGKSRMDAFMWLSSVKVGQKRESSGGPNSGAESSASRPQSGVEYSSHRRRSDSRNFINDDQRDGEGAQWLQDEYV
jgi:hypothetical protein